MKDIYINKTTLEFVSVVTRSEDLYEISLRMEEGEWIEMCQAMIDFKNECIEYGKEQGLKQGVEQGIEINVVDNVKILMHKLNYTVEQTFDLLNIPFDQCKRLEKLVMS